MPVYLSGFSVMLCPCVHYKIITMTIIRTIIVINLNDHVKATSKSYHKMIFEKNKVFTAIAFLMLLILH